MSSENKFSPADHKWMKKAIELAQKGAGYVSPNPLVGCVIVSSDGRLIGKGWHQRYGQAHAEVNALESVKDPSELIDATLYVTLEPCSHFGKTPPCAEALAKLPLKRVVVAMRDPNPQVDGRGIKRLLDAGIQVDEGLLEEEARTMNEAFIHFIRFGKPFVLLKIAQSLDGYITAPDGIPERFTSQDSLKLVHQWRATYDGVMVGSSTALHDNPRLTVRLVEGRQPVRIVIDGPGDLPDDLHLFSDQYEPKTVRVTYKQDGAVDGIDQMLQLLSGGSYQGRRLVVGKRDNHTDLREAIRRLPEVGVHSVLVEGGQQLSTAMLREGLVDKLAMFVSPFLLGGGVRSVLGLGIDRMSERMNLHRVQWQQIGTDMLMTGYL